MSELTSIETDLPALRKNGNGAAGFHAPASAPRVEPSATPGQLRGMAVVGLGYWGPNWIRNLFQSQSARRIVACDLDQKRRDHISRLYSGVETTDRFEDVLADPDIEGIVVATPVSTHYAMARGALEADKSLLVAKPLATSSAQAAEL